MPSQALRAWSSTRTAALDEIESAHQMVGGTGPGRRYATQQINQAYAMLLSSQFQGFCRDLHSKCVDVIVVGLTPVVLHPTLHSEFMLHRKLDRGNPNAGNIGADFNRLGLVFWDIVEGDDVRNHQRKQLLEELNEWRNAIAHQDFDPSRLGGQTNLRLQQVRAWRSACEGLARSFDNVMRARLFALLGSAPW